MKKLLPKISFVLFLSVGATFAVKAQTPGNATIDKNFVITINANAPVVSDYVFDISAIPFKDEAQAEKFFKRNTDNLVSYSVDFANKTATVHLALQYVEPRGWGVTEWNNYFGGLSQRYTLTYQAVRSEE